MLLSATAFSLGLTACSVMNPDSASTQKRLALENCRRLLGNPDYPAICYSGHRKDTRTAENTPGIEETKEDLRILSAMGIKLIRTYNTTLFPHSARILQSIRELRKENPDFEMYVMLGAWIQCRNALQEDPDHSSQDTEGNRREIETAIRMAHEYPDIVKIIAVGNEAMVHWQVHFVSAQVILEWVKVLQEARCDGRMPGGTLITTSDNWAALGGEKQYHSEPLAELMRRLDFLSLHTYAFHDTYYNPALRWSPLPDETNLPVAEQISRSIERAVNLQKKQVQAVRDYLNELGIDKEIHIGETGWASQDNSHYGDEGTCAASEYTAKLFYDAVQKWIQENNLTCFYFEAFDEPWKSKGTDGSEGHFGLFTVDGKARYALWDLVDEGLFEGLSREGSPIVKTHGGDVSALLKKLKAPKHLKYKPATNQE